MIVLLNKKCDECENILFYDDARCESFCPECGLVHQDTKLFSIVKYLENLEDAELQKRKKKNEQLFL